MKPILLSLALIAALSSTAWADSQGAGCGPGAAALRGQKGTFSITLAMTTDALLFPTNVFAVTSGTSGCKRDSVIQREQEQEFFMAANLHVLGMEMARGQGERVRALAVLMGCPVAAHESFARLTQERFGDVLAATDLPAQAVLANLKEQMGHDPVLAQACTRIS
jgi:hypothetical protein